MDSGMCQLSRVKTGERTWLYKSLKPELLANARYRAMLRKEAEIGMLVCKHSHYVVNYYGFFDTDNECSIQMEYVDGKTLTEIIEEEPEYFHSKKNTERFLRQLLDALKAIHHQQVVHLDLKPSNIILTRVNREVRIFDLGYCYSGIWQESMGMTTSYASPEQLDGTLDVDARSDIYSLGKLLEQLPKKAHTSSIRHIIAKCVQEDKADRWQSVDDITSYLNKQSAIKKTIGGAACMLPLFIVWWLFSCPVTGNDYHVLYGQFSLLDRTCAVTGKISNDNADIHWQGNLYIRPEIKHWGLTFKVVSIADEAFMDSTSIRTVFLPSTIRHIGVRAFEDCHNLISLHIPDSVTTIGEAAFCRTYRMEEITLPRSITSIPTVCFVKSGIRRITIPEGVTTIELDAFALCPRLHKVQLPSTLRTIERGAFWNCKRLKHINVSSQTDIGEYAFDGTQISLH